MSNAFEADFEEMADSSTQSPANLPSSCRPEDLCSLAPTRSCVYLPCKSLWPNASIDDRFAPVPLLDANGNPVMKGTKVVMIPMSKWLAQNRSVEKLVWAPGMPEFIHGKLAVDGGWVEKAGATSLNTYRAPNPKLGDPAQATRWIEHWHQLYPDEADHCIAWLACRAQRPEIMVNHALLLGGAPKIGKDTLLEAVVRTVGEWNFRTIKLNDLIAKNNDYLQTLILRVSEARDVGEHGVVDRYRLYDHIKDMITTPPSTLRINIKYVPEFEIVKCLGVVVTTNHRDALFLPPNDRRFYVAFSERLGEEFPAAYWNEFWDWYKAGGFEHVAAYLLTYDLTGFDPKAEPPKTDAFWAMVSVDRSSEHSDLADTIDALGRPDALAINQLIEKAPDLEWLHALKMRRMVRRRLEDNDYLFVINPATRNSTGMWVIKGKRQAIYARRALTIAERLTAAKELQARL